MLVWACRLCKGQNILSDIFRSGLEQNFFVEHCLINLYARHIYQGDGDVADSTIIYKFGSYQKVQTNIIGSVFELYMNEKK